MGEEEGIEIQNREMQDPNEQMMEEEGDPN